MGIGVTLNGVREIKNKIDVLLGFGKAWFDIGS